MSAGAELVAVDQGAGGEGEVLPWLAAKELEPPPTPGELVRQAVEQHLPGAVDGLARLAAGATNEEIRLKALRTMLDLAVSLGVIEQGAGSLESFVRSITGQGGAVVAALPGQGLGRED